MIGKRTRELLVGTAVLALLATVASEVYARHAVTEQMRTSVVAADLESVLRCVRQRANPNATSPGGHTPLMLAVCYGDLDAAKELLDAGANASATAPWKRGCVVAPYTPLAVAAARDDKRMVQLLLQRGADPSLRDKLGRTPAEHASDPVIRVLILAAER
ncbi:MAG: ankyrin repeat domain-containing protein [Armatimonadota bacterium]